MSRRRIRARDATSTSQGLTQVRWRSAPCSPVHGRSSRETLEVADCPTAGSTFVGAVSSVKITTWRGTRREGGMSTTYDASAWPRGKATRSYAAAVPIRSELTRAPDSKRRSKELTTRLTSRTLGGQRRGSNQMPPRRRIRASSSARASSRPKRRERRRGAGHEGGGRRPRTGQVLPPTSRLRATMRAGEVSGTAEPDWDVRQSSPS